MQLVSPLHNTDIVQDAIQFGISVTEGIVRTRLNTTSDCLINSHSWFWILSFPSGLVALSWLWEAAILPITGVREDMKTSLFRVKCKQTEFIFFISPVLLNPMNIKLSKHLGFSTFGYYLDKDKKNNECYLFFSFWILLSTRITYIKLLPYGFCHQYLPLLGTVRTPIILWAMG